jgi:hypothetical protein
MMKVVYKVTFRNGKIYVGQDRTDTSHTSAHPTRPWSPPTSRPGETRQTFAVTREILWESDTAAAAKATAVEVTMIRKHRSNDPAIGYNCWPRLGSRVAGPLGLRAPSP